MGRVNVEFYFDRALAIGVRDDTNTANIAYFNAGQPYVCTVGQAVSIVKLCPEPVLPLEAFALAQQNNGNDQQCATEDYKQPGLDGSALF
jgi:hypothetical protein